MKDFKGKTAFITGGGSGLGLGLAKVFSEAGCKIVIADIRQDHLDEAMENFRNKDVTVHPLKLDITDREAYAHAADEVEEIFSGPPELLFNNAGVNTFGPLEASTYEDWDWLMGVNLFGVVNGMQTFVPRMIKAGKGGHIVTTSSLAAFRGGPGAAIYSASKAALNNMMESYRIALEPYNIGVSVCCPANINTNIHEATRTRPEHLKKTGYLVNEDSIASMARLQASGMDPVVLANYIKQGVEENQLYIIPYPEAKDMLERHFQEILDSILPEEADPEGMKTRVEAMINWRKDPGESFGKAVPELTWVKNRRPNPPPLPKKN